MGGVDGSKDAAAAVVAAAGGAASEVKEVGLEDPEDDDLGPVAVVVGGNEDSSLLVFAGIAAVAVVAFPVLNQREPVEVDRAFRGLPTDGTFRHELGDVVADDDNRPLLVRIFTGPREMGTLRCQVQF